MKFSISEIKKLADLAKLDLSKAEINAYPKQLSEVLSYVDKIKKVKVDDSTTVVCEPMRLRADKIEKIQGDFFSDIGQERLVNAPNVFE